MPVRTIAASSIPSARAPACAWPLNHLSADGPRTLGVFQEAISVGLAGIFLAILLACFIKETGTAVGRPDSTRTKP
ncbi:MAG TPA: hypothetical protein VM689_26075 [Aliidongia sp.]|nr:hypothetical protein [Aliidongia sp.]